LTKKIYTIDENLITEGEKDQEIYHIVAGRVSIIHKGTKTHIMELNKNSFFGEISFFSELPRQVTIKSRDFTDTFIV
jgi:CRP-like cAMP-binding protein